MPFNEKIINLSGTNILNTKCDSDANTKVPEPPEEPVCGDLVVEEPAEECDCGIDYLQCQVLLLEVKGHNFRFFTLTPPVPGFHS